MRRANSGGGRRRKIAEHFHPADVREMQIEDHQIRSHGWRQLQRPRAVFGVMQLDQAPNAEQLLDEKEVDAVVLDIEDDARRLAPAGGC